MGKQKRTYIAIDLKSFYASVECRERQLDPMTTNLVVADASRTEKTICLAVSPSLKAYGISGRARLFEVEEKVREVYRKTGMKIEYLIAPPRMALYVNYSTKIYHIYLNYIAPEDIHVYSIDEVLFDATEYLDTYQLTPRELAGKMIRDVLEQTGITATAGIGSNLYLCKVALDIMAKQVDADEYGVRIAQLDELSYRENLWTHRPLTDFWRVGSGYAKKLEANGLFTMGDIARCSIGAPGDFHNEELLYKLFGVNAELLIDHAWGWEPCTIADAKSYRPATNSMCSGQVLQHPYTIEKTRLVVQEMTDAMALDLVDKQLVTDQVVLTIGYDIENLIDPQRRRNYKGEITVDRYGRKIPKHAHGTANLGCQTASSKKMTEAVLHLFDRIVDPDLLVRRINLSANHLVQETCREKKETYEQLDLFTDYEELLKQRENEKKQLEKEKKLQKAMLDIKKKYGKNAILKGISFEEGATARDRNQQIGGHKA